MLYSTIFAGLLLAVSSQYEPEEIAGSINAGWSDFIDCDHDLWDFANPNAIVHARHRDGFEDMTGGTCYYGEFGAFGNDGDGFPRDNLWGEKQWIASDAGNNFMVRINFRLFGFCDFEPSDSIRVYINDQWQDEGNDEDDQTDDNWGRQRMLVDKTKNRNNCDGWTGELTGGNTDWLDEVQCTDDNQGDSCYFDSSYDVQITQGNRFGLRFEGVLNHAFANEAFAWGKIEFTVNPESTSDEECCTGTRSDKPNKSCGAFGEARNCERKGCDWNYQRSECLIPCCRKDDSASKIKDKCKTLSDELERCDATGQNGRRDCMNTVCDCSGFWDGLNPPEGNPCP